MTAKETQAVSPESKKPSTEVPIIFQNMKTYENENKDGRFLDVKIWLMHEGQNFNGSSFSKEVVDKHIHTLSNTPILTFIEENEAGEQDFSDHRMVLHRTTDGGVEVKYIGYAVGTIPESHNARWETRVTDDGESLNYLVVDALMWTKWDDPINIMKSKGSTSQSMELFDDYTGEWDESGIFHFETFKFWGACLLGEDVMPAMKNSTAEIQFSKNDSIKNTIEDKLQEFYTLFSHKGGDKMPAKEVETQETVVSNVEFDVELPVAEVVEVEVTEPIAEEATETPEATTEEVAETEAVVPTEDTPADDFQVEEIVAEVVEVEVVAEEVVAEAVEEEVVEIVELVDYEAKFNTLSTEHTDLQSEFATLQSKLDILSTYKRQREENDLKAKFEGRLSDEEFTQVFTELQDADLTQVEEKLFALIGKKDFSVKKLDSNISTNKVVFSIREEEEAQPYGGLFEKFKK